MVRHAATICLDQSNAKLKCCGCHVLRIAKKREAEAREKEGTPIERVKKRKRRGLKRTGEREEKEGER